MVCIGGLFEALGLSAAIALNMLVSPSLPARPPIVTSAFLLKQGKLRPGRLSTMATLVIVAVSTLGFASDLFKMAT